MAIHVICFVIKFVYKCHSTNDHYLSINLTLFLAFFPLPISYVSPYFLLAKRLEKHSDIRENVEPSFLKYFMSFPTILFCTAPMSKKYYLRLENFFHISDWQTIQYLHMASNLAKKPVKIHYIQKNHLDLMINVIVTATGLEPTTTEFINEHSTIQPNWPLQSVDSL